MPKKRYATAYVETEVDVNLEEFNEEDLIEFLEDRGYVIKDEKNISDIENLYYSWLSSTPENFTKTLKKFFSENLDKNVL